MDLEQYAHALGVQVVRRIPSGSRWGSYSHRTRTIHIHPGLSPKQEAYILGHEIAHAYYGHDDCLPRWERDADVMAATLLIRLADWQKAIQMHSTVAAVAHELDVHPHVVRVYHSHLEGTL